MENPLWLRLTTNPWRWSTIRALPALPHVYSGCCCVYSTMTSASNIVLAKRQYSQIASCTSVPPLTKRFTLNSQYTKLVHWWQTAAAEAWVRIRPRGHSNKEHHHWWLVRLRQTAAQKSAIILVMQGWAFSRRWTGTERRARADSHYHEELQSAKHPCRSPRNGEVQATCQDVCVLERHQCGHWVYCEDVLSMQDQPEQSAGRDTPTTWQPRRSVASASHRPLPPWWEWIRHCYWLLPKDALCSTSDLQLHQRHGHLTSEAAVWRARHTTHTALWQWTAVRLRRVQDICSRLGIQARHKLTQIPQSNGFAERMVQTVKKTMLKARQSSTDPDLSLLSTHHPHWQQPQLSTRTCKPASRRKSSTMTRAPVTFHHSTPANMSTCRKGWCCREEARTTFVNHLHSKRWSLPS